MTLRFHDSSTAAIRDFVPLKEGQVSLYYCGATVQGEPHIGHVRSALAFDQLTRWLQTSGYDVTVVRNVTDIDDKILVKAAENNEPWWGLAYRFEQAFATAYESLGIQKPTYEPRATGHIPEMHALIAQLIERGHAYPALDDSGDVYFDVRSWKQYGSLTHQNIDDMQAAPDADPRGKRDPRDFALWKGHKQGDPETARWESPWGAGRPGWHLECSAMVTKYLGTEFDIHGGGLDLRFPHHENEMAQSQAAGHGFANFWMHNGMVTYQGEKMSKSIGNTINPREMLEIARPLVVRYYLGQAHYRSVLDYRPGSLTEAAAAVDRIETFAKAALAKLFPGNDFGYIGTRPEAFSKAMDDDLNIPAALAVLHETVRAGNTALASGDKDALQDAFLAVMGMTDALGINPMDAKWQQGSGAEAELTALDVLVKAQLDARAQARAEKNWAESDRIRELLAAAGVDVADTANGATWSLKK
ncbi:cysteine--tRNA ligase [Arthrobacter alpinus]|uniref:Cysteine--tRNA ligase n=1 Tax=Arthrobacter alpinus TaxID=656366 RepID=A0A0S2LUH8_9MICC|nr:cysteine--tRNA ligase [Arthrobacter alpinus]ALO65180.1 cysteine--tRNA ligase [Arthrobacter alpinus]